MNTAAAIAKRIRYKMLFLFTSQAPNILSHSISFIASLPASVFPNIICLTASANPIVSCGKSSSIIRSTSVKSIVSNNSVFCVLSDICTSSVSLAYTTPILSVFSCHHKAAITVIANTLILTRRIFPYKLCFFMSGILRLPVVPSTVSERLIP